MLLKKCKQYKESKIQQYAYNNRSKAVNQISNEAQQASKYFFSFHFFSTTENFLPFLLPLLCLQQQQHCRYAIQWLQNCTKITLEANLETTRGCVILKVFENHNNASEASYVDFLIEVFEFLDFFKNTPVLVNFWRENSNGLYEKMSQVSSLQQHILKIYTS